MEYANFDRVSGDKVPAHLPEELSSRRERFGRSVGRSATCQVFTPCQFPTWSRVWSLVCPHLALEIQAFCQPFSRRACRELPRVHLFLNLYPIAQSLELRRGQFRQFVQIARCVKTNQEAVGAFLFVFGDVFLACFLFLVVRGGFGHAGRIRWRERMSPVGKLDRPPRCFCLDNFFPPTAGPIQIDSPSFDVSRHASGGNRGHRLHLSHIDKIPERVPTGGLWNGSGSAGPPPTAIVSTLGIADGMDRLPFRQLSVAVRRRQDRHPTSRSLYLGLIFCQVRYLSPCPPPLCPTRQ